MHDSENVVSVVSKLIYEHAELQGDISVKQLTRPNVTTGIVYVSIYLHQNIWRMVSSHTGKNSCVTARLGYSSMKDGVSFLNAVVGLSAPPGTTDR